jgi:hypothetical protein
MAVREDGRRPAGSQGMSLAPARGFQCRLKPISPSKQPKASRHWRRSHRSESGIWWHLLPNARAAHRFTAARPTGLRTSHGRGEVEPEGDNLSSLTADSPLSKMPPRAQRREHALVSCIRGNTLNDLQSASGPTFPGRTQGSGRPAPLRNSRSRILRHPSGLLESAKVRFWHVPEVRRTSAKARQADLH